MVKADVVYKRLKKLDEYLLILSELQKYSFDDFTGGYEHYGSAERFLQLAIEALIDIGNHVIADMELGAVSWYSDIPIILADKGYLDTNLKEIWMRMIGFRNVLVHQYLEIDRAIVYNVLQHHLEDIEALKRVFVQFL